MKFGGEGRLRKQTGERHFSEKGGSLKGLLFIGVE